MQIKTENVIEFEQWTLRYHLPEGEGPHPILLLIHGWTGDENVMWIFTSHLSPRYLILAPRGIYPADEGGFGWEPRDGPGWPKMGDFRPAVDGLLQMLEKLKNGSLGGKPQFPDVDFSKLSLMGFSQGAALAYTLALTHPERIQRLAGLAGFLPADAERIIGLRPLQGKKIFVAHGTRDERVPVERARVAVRLLEQAGADVTYCEEDVGHKLAASCFHGLDRYFEIPDDPAGTSQIS